MYLYLKNCLGKEFNEPIGAPDWTQFWLIDMFSACTCADVKDDILKFFCLPNSSLRIVIATIAFGMGIDCSNARRVIHWGVSENVELYLQETGRAGLDYKPAIAILYVGGPDLAARHLEDDIKEYYENKVCCRREVLLKHFDMYAW